MHYDLHQGLDLNFMPGDLLAFIALLSWCFSDLICKIALDKKSLWFINFLGQLFGGVGILIIGLLLGKINTPSLESGGWILLFSIINLFGIFFFIKRFNTKESP